MIRFFTGFLIVCLIGMGVPTTASAQVVTGQPADSSGSGDGSEAGNFTVVLLVAVVAVVFALGWYSSKSWDDAQKSDSPLAPYALSDTGDGVAYDPDRVVSTGLAFTTDF